MFVITANCCKEVFRMKWNEIWMKLFGTTEWLGLNIGFWVSMAVVVLVVIAMNLLFWGMKPKHTEKEKQKKS